MADNDIVADPYASGVNPYTNEPFKDEKAITSQPISNREMQESMRIPPEIQAERDAKARELIAMESPGDDLGVSDSPDGRKLGLHKVSFKAPKTGSADWVKEHEARQQPAGDFAKIDQELGGSLGKGNIDLNNRKVHVYTEKGLEGRFSSLESITIEDGQGKHILIPKVTADGKMLSEQDAIKDYKASGKFLGKFDTDQEATDYAIALERRQEAYYSKGGGKKILDEAFKPAKSAEQDGEIIEDPYANANGSADRAAIFTTGHNQLAQQLEAEKPPVVAQVPGKQLTVSEKKSALLDPVKSAAAGANSMVASLVEANRYIPNFYRKAVEVFAPKVGETLNNIEANAQASLNAGADFWQQEKTPEMQAKVKELGKADIKGSVALLLKNPDLVIDQLSQSLAYLVPMGAAAKAGPTAGLIYNSLSEAMDSANSARQEAIKKGASKEDQDKASATAALVTAPLAFLGNKIVGAHKLESKFFKTGTTEHGLISSMVREAISGASEEAGNQFGQNVGANTTYDPNQSLTEGVAKAGVLGGVLESTHGAGMNLFGKAVNAVNGKPEVPVDETPPPASSPNQEASIAGNAPVNDQAFSTAEEIPSSVPSQKESLDAADLLGDENVSENNNDATGLATGTSELEPNIDERGATDSVLLPDNQTDRGNDTNAEAPAQSLGPDQPTGTNDKSNDALDNDTTAHAAATSPENYLTEPTQAQKEAGNYKVGKASVAGLDISVENPDGSTRKGVDKDGKAWESTMNGHYGYVKGVIARAPDKEHIDVNMKAGTPSDYAGEAYVINQNDANGKFDEPKVYIGYATQKEAEAAYQSNYAKGWKGKGSVTTVTMGELKTLLDSDKAFMKPLTKITKEIYTRKQAEPAIYGGKTTSWVIRNKETGETIRETFQKSVADKVNTDKYEAVPIMQHLQELNDLNSKVRKFVKTPVDTPIMAEIKAVKAKKKAVKKSAGTLLAKMIKLDGINMNDKLDVTGEKTRFAPGGYNQLFKADARNGLKSHIERGDLDEYLPPAMRLETNGMNDSAYDSTEAYDYLADKIRNGERVLPHDVEEEIKASKYYDEQQAQEDIELFDEDDVNKLLSEAGYEEREVNAAKTDYGIGLEQNEQDQAGSNRSAENIKQASTDSDASSSQGTERGERSETTSSPKIQSAPKQESADQGIRDKVVAITKRRAAAAQIGKSKQFDTSLAQAKAFMNGEEISPRKFLDASITFKNDPPLAEQYKALYELAKAPEKVAKAEKTGAVDTYKTIIQNAKTVAELQAIAKDIQAETGFSDTKVAELDDLVFDAIDVLENSDTNDTTEKHVDETENNRQDKLTINEPKFDNNLFKPETSKAQEATPVNAPVSTDLLGEDTTKQQAVADAERAKDAKRNSGNDNQDTFTLTGSNSEADIAAANGAQDLFAQSVSKKIDKSDLSEEVTAKPDEIDAARISKGYAHRVLGSTNGAIEVERQNYIKTINSFYDDLLPISKNDAQKAELINLTKILKNEYLERRYRVMDVGSSVVSSAVAGRSKFNSRQSNTRGNALDRAEESFSSWLKGYEVKAKQTLLSLKTSNELEAERNAMEDKAAKKDAELKVYMGKYLNFKSGDKLKAGNYYVSRVSKDRDGYPSSFTVDATDLTENKFYIAKILFGGSTEKLRAMVDKIRAEQSSIAAIKASEEITTSEKIKLAADLRKGDITAEDVTSIVGENEPANIKKQPETPLNIYDTVMEEYRKGVANVDDYKAAFEYVLNNEDLITNYLNTNFTKVQLLDRGVSDRYKSEPKARMASAVYSDMVSDFLLPNENGFINSSYSFGGDRHADIKRQVGEITQKSLDAAMKRRLDKIKENEATKAERLKGAANPKTIDDYTNYLRGKMSEDMTLKEARFTLSPGQRATYDNLYADKTMSERANRVEKQQTSVQAAGQTVEGNIIETKHTKKGHELFVVQLSDRVSKEDYTTLNTSAKKLGGYYSSFRGQGAVVGFQFTSKENAQAFVDFAGGNTETTLEAIKERRNAYADDRTQTAVERLTEMAERLESKAEEQLAQVRKTNTSRRAGMAARADAAAEAEKAMAVTMRNIASSIQSGKSKYLGKVRQKVQVELLQSLVTNAQYDKLRKDYPSYQEYEKNRYEPMTEETADFAEFPSYSAYRSDLASLARSMADVDGLKLISNKILGVADDVSDAYIKFAKENINKVSTFRAASGERAAFSSKALAEQAISRSNFKGQAIVLPFKRGENLIILSPAEAMKRGIWIGDNDKRITLSADFGAELVEKLGKANRKANKVNVPWQFESAYEKRDKLKRMGIENPAEMRSALREFIGLRETVKAPDKIKEMERKMIGRKNDGLDFFPTPSSVADQMIDTADLQEGMSVLEPSAGMGHIAERIREAGYEADVAEFSGDRRELLEEKGFNVVASDFMEISEKYDRIIMNPPFSDRRDEQHVRHAYELLKPNGKIVAIMGEGVFFGDDKKATAFRDWLESVGGTSEKLEEGTFLDSSLPVNTGVNARMVVIQKQDGDALLSRSAIKSTDANISRGNEQVNQARGATSSDLRSSEPIRTRFSEGATLKELSNISDANVKKAKSLAFLNRAGLQLSSLTQARSSSGKILRDTDLVKNQAKNKPVLSRNDGFGLPMYRAEEIIADITKEYKSLPKVIIVESTDELPIDDALKSSELGDIEGMFYQGNIYINTGAIYTEERMREVFAHEAIGHLSVETMLDEVDSKLMPQLIKQVKMLDAGGNKYIRELAASVDSSQPNLKANKDFDTRAKEIIAQIAERGDQDKNLTPMVRTMWQKIIDGIKAFAKLVFDVDMTDQDVRDIVTMAARYARGDDVVSMLKTNKAFFSKSSDINNGNFDGGNKDIMFSRSEAQQWESPEDSRFDDIRRTLQDKHIDLKRVVQNIKKVGVDLADRFDAYLQEELYHGRAAKRTEDFVKTELEPLLQAMRIREVSMADLEKYLWARHAEERNIQIAKINPDMPDGGSGMKTQDALDYLAKLNPVQTRSFEALAKRIDAINKGTRQTLIDYGLESESTIAKWDATYKNYVPLQRDEMDLGFGMGTGAGFSTKGTASKRATGSNLEVVDIIANIAQQRERNIVRGEKNRVATALFGLAQTNPNKSFWEIDKPPRITMVSKSTGLVEEYTDPNYKNRPNVVVARIKNKAGDIEERAIVFSERDERAKKMAASIKNLDVEQMEKVLEYMSHVTRYFASVNTQYNPVFGVLNILRDVQGALLNLSTTPLAGKQAEILAHTGSAMRGIYQDMRSIRRGDGATQSDWSKLWEEFQREGGKTGYRDMFANAAERTQAIEKALDPEWWTKTKVGKVISANGFLTQPEMLIKDKAVKPIFDWLSDYNETLENSVRLAVYKSGLDKGLSKQQSASIAKNISVNFNRKGNMGRTLGAVYAFFNASVQGTARIAETLTGKRGKQIMAGGLMLGAMQALLLAAYGYDEDEPPEFVRNRNIIVPLDIVGIDKKYVTLPMPLGFNAIPNFGRMVTEFVLSGGEDVSKHLSSLLGMALDTFNPIGGNGSISSIYTPTALDPFNDLDKNKDWTGRAIAQEDFNSLNPTPGFTRSRDKAWAVSVELARYLNNLSGGTNYKQGVFSPTADQIEYLAGQVTGGVGRELIKAGTTLDSFRTGEDLPSYKIPLAGRFYGNAKGQAAQGSEFYNNLRLMNEHEAEIKGRVRDHLDIAEYRKENPESILIAAANQSEKAVKKLRKMKDNMIERNAPAADIKVTENQITFQMERFNKLVKEKRE